MIKEVIKKEVQDIVLNEFPHAKEPQIVICKVTKGGSSEINLKVLDEYGNIDSRFAEIPRVKVKTTYETGDKVVVLFLYGKIEMAYVLELYPF